MAEPKTILHALEERAAELQDKPALWTRRGGVYLPTSWREYAARVRRFALGLEALGFRRGDVLAILSFNREEWLVADLAAMALGGATVGLYTTASAGQQRALLAHCEAKVLVVENEQHLRTAEAIRQELPKLSRVVVMDPPVRRPDDTLTYTDVMAEGQGKDEGRFYKRLEQLRPDGLAQLIYTSGTTGAPKGVMLSHKNLTWTTTKVGQTLGLGQRERLLSYLPLSHIAEQVLSIYGPIVGGLQVYFAESFDALGQNLREVRPTLFFGVPRVWEKLKLKAEEGFSKLAPHKARLLTWAREVAGARNAMVLRHERVPVRLETQYLLAQRLVFAPLRERLGFGRTWLFATGAAHLGADVLEFFASLDIVLREVYGQSEGSGPTSVSTPEHTRFGLSGRPMLGVEVRIAEDGEILVRGDNVCLGYYKDRAATAALLEDGWLHSGDLGELADGGYLRITGRKKELLVTSGGKKTAPAHLESLLRAIPPVGHAVVLGEGRHYLSALLTLDPERVAVLLAARRFSAAPDRLAEDAEFRSYLQQQIEAQVNARVARFEGIRKFEILERDFSVSGGELTPSLKVRRPVVEEKYRAQIEALYATPK